MAFIKEESEDFRIEEVFSLKQEETEELTELLVLKEENQDLNEMKQTDQYEKHHDLITGEGGTQTKTGSVRKRAQKTKSNSSFTCHLCEKSFNEIHQLQMHMRFHTGEKSFPCQHCGKSFPKPGALKRHVRTPTGEKPYTCEQCGKSFTQKTNLQRHMVSHSGEKPYTCHLCGKSVTQKSSLKSHMKIHTGEKPYTCEQCGKSFPGKQNLKVHMSVHAGKKPYSCDYCGKSFTSTYSRKCHMRIHTVHSTFNELVVLKEENQDLNETEQTDHYEKHHDLIMREEDTQIKAASIRKRAQKTTFNSHHTCDHCQRSFVGKQKLKMHMRVHTGERPFTCQQCGKRFTQEANLQNHMESHTGEKPFTCQQCGKSFRNKCTLSVHLRKQHTREMPVRRASHK